MARGRKTGGRTKGTPNRATLDVLQRLEGLGCDPIEGMAKLAMNPKNSPDLRGRMFSELANYCCPKRRAIEVAADIDMPWVRASNAEELCLKLDAVLHSRADWTGAGRAANAVEPAPRIQPRSALEALPRPPVATRRTNSDSSQQARHARSSPRLDGFTDGGRTIFEPDY
jgi:hypothetical protein